MKKIRICIILAVLLMGCKTEPTGKKEGIEREFCNILQYGDDPFRFEEIIDTNSYIYIPLETNPDSFIGEISKVKVDDNKIFVLDRGSGQSILRFDMSGKFLGAIGAKGRGPGEYIKATDFVLDTNKKHIILADYGTNRISFFTYDGEFLKTMIMGFLPFAYLSNGNFLFLGNPTTTKEQYELIEVNENNEFVGGFCSRQNFQEKEAYEVIHDYFFQINHEYYFIPLYTDSLYRINEQSIEFVTSFGFQKDIFEYNNCKSTKEYYSSNKLGKVQNFVINSLGHYFFRINLGRSNILCGYGNINTQFQSCGSYELNKRNSKLIFALNPIGSYKDYFINSISYAYLFPKIFPNSTENDNPTLVLFKTKSNTQTTTTM